jgi:hypothetical protein
VRILAVLYDFGSRVSESFVYVLCRADSRLKYQRVWNFPSRVCILMTPLTIRNLVVVCALISVTALYYNSMKKDTGSGSTCRHHNYQDRRVTSDHAVTVEF